MKSITALALAWAAPFAAGADTLVASEVTVMSSTRYALRDLDGDGSKEFLTVGPSGIAVTTFGADGALNGEPTHRMLWPTADLAWDLTDATGDGTFEFLMLLNGTELHAYSWNGSELVDGGAVLTAANTYLPPGIRHIRMARDVDDDGIPDIVLPAIDRYLIHVATAPRVWSAPLGVRFTPDITLDVGDPSSLDDEFGQSVRIPWFSLRDIDGDDHADLVSTTADDVTFYIADETLPDQPTWTLDLASMRDTRSARERFDLDNLLTLIGDQVNWRVGDVDGKGAWDLIIQQGDTVRLYLGGSHGADLGAPDQVLKASGNVLHTLIRDVNNDGRRDLQIVRTENLSAARIIRWLVFAGSLDLNVFTYRNEGGSFARKPSHRSTLRLQIPAILTSLDDFEEMGDRLGERTDTPTRALAFDGDGILNDVVDVREGRILVFRNVIDGDPERLAPKTEVRSVDDLERIVEEVLLKDLDSLEDGGVKTIDLLEPDELVTSIGWELRQRTLGKTPTVSLPLSSNDASFDDDVVIRVADIDGDGRSDVIVTGEDNDSEGHIKLLIARDAR